ncbi:MAG: NAD(+) diphosphatase [Gemmatimonadota bacterium]|nr:MAG: NAD(+) diphosphatase [Gemmatimonadota bacterium]
MTGRPEELWFAFSGREMLVADRGGDGSVPSRSELVALGVEPVLSHTLSAGPLPAMAVELSEPFVAPEGFHLRRLRSLFTAFSEEEFALAGRSFQLVEWGRTNRHCGRCGAGTEKHERELAMMCTECGRLHFPKISPAVIVQVTRDPDEILLGRNLTAPPGCYSVLAGFVEPGESLEQTVAREIREEVAIEVADIRYFGSQPWPFPGTLMVGFTARYTSGELAIDGTELSDAGWFKASDLPPVPPRFSIARRLIDEYVARCGRDPSTLPEWST